MKKNLPICNVPLCHKIFSEVFMSFLPFCLLLEVLNRKIFIKFADDFEMGLPLLLFHL